MSDEPKTNRQRWLLPSVLVVWAGFVSFGLYGLLRYSFEPGSKATAPRTWPAGTRVPLSHVATLIVAVHPRCACTRATLGELEIILAQCAGHVAANILMYRPANSAIGWADTDLRSRAFEIPGLKVVDDSGGVEANRFGALTSGQVLLYSAAGSLLFEGGITASRGHSGDNTGRDAIIVLLRHEPIGISSTPVFGCSLREQSRPAERVK
ncbi:MAG: hypothetical protein WB676_05595 [Bryobacteraceae bacterium]